MSNVLIRTFCFHSWDKWSTPFCGTWANNEEAEEKTFGRMTQRRTCEKCGQVRYRKCS